MEHHAEDVVHRVLIKWAAMKPGNARARIEQVIKTEAYSLLRSEHRARQRDTNAVTDRSSSIGGGFGGSGEIVELRRSIVETCHSEGITLWAVDIEVLELLFAGYSLSDIVRETDYSRHTVKMAKRRLQELLRRVSYEPSDRPSSPT